MPALAADICHQHPVSATPRRIDTLHTSVSLFVRLGSNSAIGASLLEPALRRFVAQLQAEFPIDPPYLLLIDSPATLDEGERGRPDSSKNARLADLRVS